MTPERFQEITSRYAALSLAVAGDYCLDKYLEIDPAMTEVSIETGLPVHNVVHVRGQPGGAGTIVNNLSALGVGTIWVLGFAGVDGEGYELRRALEARRGTRLDQMVVTPLRRTFTYAKPLLMHRDRPPEELNRLDSKNWDPTPSEVEDQLVAGLDAVGDKVDGIVLLDQVDVPNTGVVTRGLLAAAERCQAKHPDLPILADSRRGLRGFPPVTLKMNLAELAVTVGSKNPLTEKDASTWAADLAKRRGRPVVVTMAEKGMLGSDAQGQLSRVASRPVRGPIDVVGAGDAVTANLTASLAAGANLSEAMELATAAASHVIHQLGTTGTACVGDLRTLLLDCS